tara:strand:- start:278 stop:841 length:564 start_codon:yes stop_codon:yes gene_type:complete
MKKFNIKVILSLLTLVFLNSCEAIKYKKVSAKDFPPQPEQRVQKNMEEGRGFQVFGKNKRGGEFEFANSNSMWRASLDTIDFIPLLSVDYGGGLIITDWYNDGGENQESIKLTIKFLSNEIRSDSIDVKVFKKKCLSMNNCKTTSTESELNSELKLAILKKAAIYEKNKMTKNKRKYFQPKTGNTNN